MKTYGYRQITTTNIETRAKPDYKIVYIKCILLAKNKLKIYSHKQITTINIKIKIVSNKQLLQILKIKDLKSRRLTFGINVDYI